jgi:hypothetical protein
MVAALMTCWLDAKREVEKERRKMLIELKKNYTLARE